MPKRFARRFAAPKTGRNLSDRFLQHKKTVVGAEMYIHEKAFYFCF
jgi:hypothetical protein